MIMQRCFVLSFILWLSCVTAVQGTVYLSCDQDNDLYQVLVDNDISCRRFDNPGQAVAQAPSNAGVLILAQDYPLAATHIKPSVLDEASHKNLRLYIEFPKRITGIRLGSIQKAPLARGVVTSDLFGEALAPMRILAMHGCHFCRASFKDLQEQQTGKQQEYLRQRIMSSTVGFLSKP